MFVSATHARGALTVVRRRGLSYLAYLVSQYAWPDLAYRFLWGSTAPRPLRRVVTDLMRRPPVGTGIAATELTALDLVAPRSGGEPCAVDREAAERLMDRAHAAGLAGVRDAWDALVAGPDGQPRFPPEAPLRRYPGRGVPFMIDRDADREAFNRRFDADVLTERSARDKLRTYRGALSAYRDYAPIDFGGGLSVGVFPSTDSGTGRWDFFNGGVVGPVVRGKRVIDLGCNNASQPLMMARAGAASIVGVEQSPEIAAFARLNVDILKWRDLRPYDIRIVTGDMRIFVEGEVGTADVVTAFCSLYYLPPEDMAAVIRAAARMGATLILQSNEAIDNLPAKAAELRRLMTAHGYARVSEHSAPGFDRVLLVGTTA